MLCFGFAYHICVFVCVYLSSTHLLVVCVLVNSTCMIISWLSESCQRSLGSVNEMIFGDKVWCAPASSHHQDVTTQLDRTVAISMLDCEWARTGSRSVHGDPFGGVWIISSNKKNCLFRCRTAVVNPADCCVQQMPPRSFFVNLTGVVIADNQGTRVEVCSCTIAHLPWEVVEDAAPLLGITSRPKLNRSRCSFTFASYHQDPCKVIVWSTICIDVSVQNHHDHNLYPAIIFINVIF